MLSTIKPLLTTREVAELVNVHPNTIKRLADRGILPFVRISARGDRRYSETDVLALLIPRTDVDESGTQRNPRPATVGAALPAAEARPRRVTAVTAVAPGMIPSVEDGDASALALVPDPEPGVAAAVSIGPTAEAEEVFAFVRDVLAPTDSPRSSSNGDRALAFGFIVTRPLAGYITFARQASAAIRPIKPNWAGDRRAVATD